MNRRKYFAWKIQFSQIRIGGGFGHPDHPLATPMYGPRLSGRAIEIVNWSDPHFLLSVIKHHWTDIQVQTTPNQRFHIRRNVATWAKFWRWWRPKIGSGDYRGAFWTTCTSHVTCCRLLSQRHEIWLFFTCFGGFSSRNLCNRAPNPSQRDFFTNFHQAEYPQSTSQRQLSLP